MNRLNKIKDRLMVNELHIIDENGIITSSMIPSYIGFDMKSGEQSIMPFDGDCKRPLLLKLHRSLKSM